MTMTTIIQRLFYTPQTKFSETLCNEIVMIMSISDDDPQDSTNRSIIHVQLSNILNFKT